MQKLMNTLFLNYWRWRSFNLQQIMSFLFWIGLFFLGLSQYSVQAQYILKNNALDKGSKETTTNPNNRWKKDHATKKRFSLQKHFNYSTTQPLRVKSSIAGVFNHNFHQSNQQTNNDQPNSLQGGVKYINTSINSLDRSVGMFIKFFDNNANTSNYLVGKQHKTPQTITFSLGDNATKEIDDQAFYLTAITTSGLPVTFTSSHTQVATIEGHKVSIVGAGTTTIIASQIGNNDYNAATDVTQVLAVKPRVTELPIVFNQAMLRIYPNPVTDQFTLCLSRQTPTGTENKIKTQFYSTQGRLLHSRQTSLPPAKDLLLDVGWLASGTYYLIITLPSGQQIQRKIFKR